MTPEFIQRLQTTEGTRPPAAPIPEPGIYWIKETRCDFYWVDETGARLEHPLHNHIWSIYTWELQRTSEWLLAQVDARGDYSVMESDETTSWERTHSLVTHVGPRVEPPKEAA